MQTIIEKDKCTGCTACYNGCPMKAIEMQTSDDGFRYPKIDQTKCIDCEICKRVCPVLKDTNNESLKICYASYNKNQSIRSSSSSGGIFSAIANQVIAENGIVIGAAFDNYINLKHISVDNYNDLEKLRGSKYVESDLGSIFNYIKICLDTKKVLFVGTPCQVAGLKSFLKKDYENLITLDFICHGVPSNKVFKKYCEEIERKYNQEIKEFYFRDKSKGWKDFSIKIILKNTTLIESHKLNPYMKLFLYDLALKPSCYNCKFKSNNSHSDITLGDFWGVTEDLIGDSYSGISAVILNTYKGKQYLELIKKDLILKNVDYELIAKNNPAIDFSCPKPFKRKAFFKNIDKKSINELVDDYVPKNNFLNRYIDLFRWKLKRK